MQPASTIGWFILTMAHNVNAHLTHLLLQMPLPLSLPRVSGPPSLVFLSSLGSTKERVTNSKEMRMSRRNMRQIQIRKRKKIGLLVDLARKMRIKRGVQEMMRRGERMVQVLESALSN